MGVWAGGGQDASSWGPPGRCRPTAEGPAGPRSWLGVGRRGHGCNHIMARELRLSQKRGNLVSETDGRVLGHPEPTGEGLGGICQPMSSQGLGVKTLPHRDVQMARGDARVSKGGALLSADSGHGYVSPTARGPASPPTDR